MKRLGFAVFGAGFWARFQLGGWHELEGVECCALFNRTRSKAQQLAREFGVPSVYDDAKELLNRERPDFVHIVTNPPQRFMRITFATLTPILSP